MGDSGSSEARGPGLGDMFEISQSYMQSVLRGSDPREVIFRYHVSACTTTDTVAFDGIQQMEEQVADCLHEDERSWAVATDLLEEGRVVRRQPKMASSTTGGWNFRWSPGQEIVAAGPAATYGPFRMYARSDGPCGAFANAPPSFSHHLNLPFLEAFFLAQAEVQMWKDKKRPRSFAHESRSCDASTVEILSYSPAPPEARRPSAAPGPPR